MLYTERKERILKHLHLSNLVKIPDLMEELNVSIDTVRRDLKSMEGEGLLKCVRGGACLPDMDLQFSNFNGREIIHIDKKREAAKKAITFIQDGDLIFLNSGTTNTILAQELLHSNITCTIITNNIAAISVLTANPSIKVVVLGGELDATERSVYGTQCEAELKTYYPDLCFLSINAVHIDHGFTDFRFHEIPIIKRMVTQSKKVIAVMDSTKIGTLSKRKVLEKEDIKYIAMDSHLQESERERYIKGGYEII